MRNIIIGLLSVTLAGLCIAGSFPNDGKIYAIGYGEKNATVLQSVVDSIGTTERTIVLTGGAWDIDANLSIPSNATLEVIAGSYLDVANGVVVTADCTIVAGIYKIFDGSGTANGSCSMLWRPDVWGDTNQFQIGSGLISLQDAQDLAEVLAEGSDALGDEATGFSTLQAATGTFDNITMSGTFLNSSNDMAESYLGYPKIALTTNMVTAEGDGGTEVSPDAFTNIFDNSLTTKASGTLGSNNDHSYLIDLGDNYQGFIQYTFAVSNVTGGVNNQMFASQEAIDIAGGTPNFYDNAQSSATTGATNKTTLLTPLSGRYLMVWIYVGSSQAAIYDINDISVYANTNGYRNMGGF